MKAINEECEQRLREIMHGAEKPETVKKLIQQNELLAIEAMHAASRDLSWVNTPSLGMCRETCPIPRHEIPGHEWAVEENIALEILAAQAQEWRMDLRNLIAQVMRLCFIEDRFPALTRKPGNETHTERIRRLLQAISDAQKFSAPAQTDTTSFRHRHQMMPTREGWKFLPAIRDTPVAADPVATG